MQVLIPEIEGVDVRVHVCLGLLRRRWVSKPERESLRFRSIRMRFRMRLGFLMHLGYFKSRHLRRFPALYTVFVSCLCSVAFCRDAKTTCPSGLSCAARCFAWSPALKYLPEGRHVGLQNCRFSSAISMLSALDFRKTGATNNLRGYHRMPHPRQHHTLPEEPPLPALSHHRLVCPDV